MSSLYSCSAAPHAQSDWSWQWPTKCKYVSSQSRIGLHKHLLRSKHSSKPGKFASGGLALMGGILSRKSGCLSCEAGALVPYQNSAGHICHCSSNAILRSLSAAFMTPASDGPQGRGHPRGQSHAILISSMTQSTSLHCASCTVPGGDMCLLRSQPNPGKLRSSAQR